MFTPIFKTDYNVLSVFIVAGVSILVGLFMSLLASRRVHSTRGFFASLTVMPLLVSVVVALLGAFLKNSTATLARIATIGVALGLIRFRSINGKADEMVLLLGGIIVGLILGLGYVAFGVILAIVFTLIFLLMLVLPVFNNKKFGNEKLLKITIPESLNYSEVFNKTFVHYLKSYEQVEVKTTGMGSMYKLSFKVVLKNPKEEKELIDELRTRNGNLEISVLPYVESRNEL